MFKLETDWKYEESPGPQVTAYTTTWNCLNGKYPVEQSIESFAWCDKICVVDGGSTDGTRELLSKLCEKYPHLTVYDIPIDESLPGKDGNQKAMALAMVDTPLAIQFDIDEVCKGDTSKWRALIKDMDAGPDILSLPVVEPYGDLNHVRVNKSHTPWKWRVYKVKPEITHGIPEGDRLEKDGVLYSKGGSDGCFPVHVVTNQMIPSMMNKMSRNLTKTKNSGDFEAYKTLLLSLFESGEPYILHLGHVELHQKLKHYLQSWHKWWCQLYAKDENDPANNLYFPGVAVQEVSDEMIAEKVKNLMEETPYVDLGQR